MSGYLLDTQVLLRILAGDVDKNSDLYAILGDSSVRVVASAANVLEVAIKKAMKRVVVPNDFEGAVTGSGFEVLPISGEHAWKTLRLPFFHADAVDRLLIAQAVCEDLVLITQDNVFDAYQINTLKI